MIDYNPDASEFFITTVEQFEKLKGHQIQEIFRHRHIVIPGTTPEDIEFNNQGLATLGLLTAKRQIQGVCVLCFGNLSVELISLEWDLCSESQANSGRPNNNDIAPGDPVGPLEPRRR